MSENPIRWHLIYDESDNDVWEGASPYDGDDGAVCWRLKQQLFGNKVEWVESHDAELVCGRGAMTYATLDDAKADCQRQHDEIIAQTVAEKAIPPASEAPDDKLETLISSALHLADGIREVAVGGTQAGAGSLLSSALTHVGFAHGDLLGASAVIALRKVQGASEKRRARTLGKGPHR